MRIIKSDVYNSHVGHVVADFFCRFCPWALQLILLSRINLFSAHSFLDICSYRQEVKLDLQLVKSALFIRMLTSWKAVQWYFSWLSMMFSKYRIDGMFSIYRIEGTTHIACHMGSYVMFSAHVTTLIIRKMMAWDISWLPMMFAIWDNSAHIASHIGSYTLSTCHHINNQYSTWFAIIGQGIFNQR